MTRPELIRWANAPEQKDNVIAEAVRNLLRQCDSAHSILAGIILDLNNAQAAIRTYDAECARLRKAAQPKDKWDENEEVPA